jgi:hypothetical protein
LNEQKHRAEQQSWLMLDAFASVGVRSVDITLTDLDGHKCSFYPGLKLEMLRNSLSDRIDNAIRLKRNVIVRPRGATATLVQLDDLDRVSLERVTSATFLIVNTSPENYQAWVAVRDGRPDFVRRLRHGCGADPCASGAVRLAGSVNFKPCYAPLYPLVTVEQVVPQRMMGITKLATLGLVTAVQIASSIRRPRVSDSGRFRVWPSYRRCLQNAPLAHRSDRPDISRADFTFCLLALDWGWSEEETCARLLEESSKARERGPIYARLTVERAGAVVQRRKAEASR